MRRRRRLRGGVGRTAGTAGGERGRAVCTRAVGCRARPDDVPSFAAKPDWCPVFLRASLRQFEGLEDAADVLVNSFHEIEPKQ
ncbi:hypothetical protein ZEAMMB73_Zm00001d037870 [Zea mays]|uniref:Uncharacterized protein n=1 Tax=Zea mays TaxID=4577 RepID=A0A1D6M1D9_MAIZE|nr:hypothetical protein ZEAMMB73_Zm00001d037870 [Zea mays]